MSNDVIVEKGGQATASGVVATVENIVQSTHITGELPTGYLDDDGKLHKLIELRPYTGAEEDILASDKMPFYRRIGKLLEECVIRIGDLDERNAIRKAVRKLIFSDRLYAMVQLRIATNGPIYSMEMVCPEEDCKAKSMQHVDLRELKWVGLPEPTKRQYTVTLSSGRKANWNVMDGVREERANQFSYSKDLLSIGIYARLNDVDGRQATMDMVKGMSIGERKELRKAFNAHEGSIDDDVEFECATCGHIWKASVDYGHMSFFFPTDE